MSDAEIAECQRGERKQEKYSRDTYENTKNNISPKSYSQESISTPASVAPSTPPQPAQYLPRPIPAQSHSTSDDTEWGPILFGILICFYLIAAVFEWLGRIFSKTSTTAAQVYQENKPAIDEARDVAAVKVQNFLNRNKRCPYCDEKIRKDALVCKHCHRDIPP